MVPCLRELVFLKEETGKKQVNMEMYVLMPDWGE